MDCFDVKKFVYVYLDDEFDARERGEFEQHMRDCETCRRIVHREQRFHNFIQKHTPRIQAPATLYSSLRQKLSAPEGNRTFLGNFAFRLVPATAILSLILFLFCPTLSGFSPFVDSAVELHNQNLPMDVWGDANAIVAFLDKNVRFDFKLPLKESNNIKLIGARVSSIANKQAILYYYDYLGKKVTVAQIKDDNRALGLTSTPDSPNENHIRFIYQKGYHIAVFKRNALTNSVIGDLTRNDLINLIQVAATQ